MRLELHNCRQSFEISRDDIILEVFVELQQPLVAHTCRGWCALLVALSETSNVASHACEDGAALVGFVVCA